MFKTTLESLGIEAIKYQFNKVFFKELVLFVSDIKDSPDMMKSGIEQIEKVIFKRTGINVSIEVPGNFMLSPYVEIPRVGKNHPLLNDFQRKFVDNKQLEDIFRQRQINKLKASVDRSTHRVSGVFSEIPQKMYIPAKCFTTDTLTAEELASLIAHEIGHIFTFYEMLVDMIVTNYVLSAAAKLEDDEKVLEIDFFKSAVSELELPNSLSSDVGPKEFIQFISEEKIKKRQSIYGTDIYDFKAAEQLADEFAGRLGGHRHLATALDKLMRLNADPAYQSNLVRYFLMVPLMIIGLPIALPVTLLVYCITGITPDHNAYDTPEDRLKRIKQDVIATFRKYPNMSKESEKDLLASIDVIEERLSSIKTNDDIIRKLWRLLSPTTRKQYELTNIMKTHERLINNDLYVKARKLSNV